MTERLIQPRGRHTLPEGRQVCGVYFEKRQIQRLDQLSEQQDLSRSILIRKAVDRFLEEAGV